MEKTLEVTVCGVNIGKFINTRREVLGALRNCTPSSGLVCSVACCYKVGIRFSLSFFEDLCSYIQKSLMQNKNGLIGGVPMEIMQVCAVYFFSSFISGRKNEEKAVPRSPLLLGNFANFLAKRVALWRNLKPLLLLLFGDCLAF